MCEIDQAAFIEAVQLNQVYDAAYNSMEFAIKNGLVEQFGNRLSKAYLQLADVDLAPDQYVHMVATLAALQNANSHTVQSLRQLVQAQRSSFGGSLGVFTNKGDHSSSFAHGQLNG